MCGKSMVLFFVKLVPTCMVGREQLGTQASAKKLSCTIADKMISNYLPGTEPNLPHVNNLLDAGVQSFGSEEDKDKGPLLSSTS